MSCCIMIRATTPQTLTFLYGNNEGADQPTHAHSLVSAIVI